MIVMTSSFSKSFVFRTFSVHAKTQSRRFQIPPPGLKNERCRKAPLRDGLVWTVGLTVELKVHFQIGLALCGQDQSGNSKLNKRQPGKI